MSAENGGRIDRRKFLVHTGRGMLIAGFAQEITNLAAAAAQTPAMPIKLPAQKAMIEQKESEASESLPADERVGFAIVGLGRLSIDQLIPAFGASKKAKLTALVTGHPEKAEKLARENGVKPENIYRYENFDRIADNPEVKVVYIVLPNSMHAEYTERAAAAGKHVLCEKPMEVSSAKCQQMIDTCKKANVKLMIAYRIQYEPMNRLIQKLVRERTFGAVKFMDSVNGQVLGDPTQWRLRRDLSGSGALGDLGVYCLNTIRFLLGEEPSEIFGRTVRPSGDVRFKEVDETIIWQMTFPSGVLAHCGCSFNFHDLKSYRVCAERGNFGLESAFSYAGLKMQINHAEGEAEHHDTPTTETKNQFALELDHMADCVLRDRKPYTPGEEGLQDQRIIEAIFESAKTGKIVKLPTPPAGTLDAFRGPPPD